MKSTLILSKFLLLLLLFSLNTFANSAGTTSPQKGRHQWWTPRHQEKLAEAQKGGIDLVMIGDSITHFWEKQKTYPKVFAPYKVLNLGFGGDRTQNVLWRIQNGEIDGLSPKFVTIMIGTNNISSNQVADIASGIKAIVSELKKRLPETKVLLFSVFPRHHSRGKGEDYKEVQALNKLIPAIADDKQVFHHDLTAIFQEENGELKTALYGRDRLHLSNEGYAAWGKALNAILAKYDSAKSAKSPSSEKKLNSQQAPIIRLWPIERVGSEENRLKLVFRDRRGRKQLCGVKDPYLTVYPAKTDKPAVALIYNPGGAYKVLGIPTKEHIKEWNDLGITVFVHRYSIPDKADQAFQDLQRTLRLVRFNAKKWNIDPNNIGVFGNSAGGHLSARLTQNYDQKVYEDIDEADQVSCEPNFAILQCAAYFQGIKMDKDFDAEMFPMKNSVAPTFLTYSKDDKFCMGGVEYDKRLKAAGGAIELKLYEKGGHGMGGCDWFSEAKNWLKEQKIIADQ
ncbi:TonB-like protein [Lentisphaera araneosa HTCC2155]|jgi:acetyl esterase/lipase/lysophospholipase L1-like esterase|uniref:TonB-like protein n=1 Tax=Lentisphaera araneosa HTCC2155 TaxID=313628 RepID=A6DGK6_9BACT|nr:GDSL-type esterase/lipase family protein [Lentisphaera araneosa]EDM29323.1 TonB-like protein [Lentisphaera araneosa HTCC2155]